MKSAASSLIVLLPICAGAETRLDPTLHLTVVAGAGSANELADVAYHGHDPNDDFALQGLDIGLNLHHDDWLSAFVNVNTFTKTGGGLDAEWEEGFVKFQRLPGNFELRAGRFLNRFGIQNNQHLHGWDFVNANLSTTRFLGEEALITEGFEATWLHESDRAQVAVSASFGKAASHEEHGDEDGHDGIEKAYFSDELVTMRSQFVFNANDFHQHRLGLNGGWGDNGFGTGSETSLYSADYVYRWRENGLESGGREFATGLEVFFRDIEWADDEGVSGSDSQNGYMIFGRYRFAEPWVADVRYEELQGRRTTGEVDFGADQLRISFALTREFTLAKWDSYARLQYSHDDLESDSEDTLWLQFGFNFGEGEVR